MFSKIENIFLCTTLPFSVVNFFLKQLMLQIIILWQTQLKYNWQNHYSKNTSFINLITKKGTKMSP